MTPSLRNAALAAAAALSFLLAGCTTVSTAPTPARTEPQPGSGVVVVSITGNTARVAQFDSITVRKLQTVNTHPGAPRELHLLQQVAPGLARDTALFIGVLPPGEYVFERLTAGQQFIGLGENSQKAIGTFTVVAAQTSDLGRLVVTPLNTRVVVGRSQLVQSNADFIRRFSPDNAKPFAGVVNAGWNAPRTKEDQVEAYALSRPVGADALTELADGGAAAASRVGTILLRSKEGRWRASRTGSLESLLWLKPVDLPDARLIAVGEFNTIVRLDRQGRVTRVDPGNLPPGNLVFVDGDPRAGWFIALQSGAKLTLFRSPALDGGQWTAVREEDVGRSFWSGANQFWAWPTKSGFAYAVSAGDIRLFDFTTQAWTERKAPNNSRLVGVAPAADGGLGILTSPGGGFAGVFATMYVSRDNAATWAEIKSPFSIKVAPPRLVGDGRLLVTGGVFSKPELHASGDGGKTWQLVTADIKLNENLVLLPTTGMFAIDNGQQFGLASIRRSADGGATWRLEYSNFDRAVYDAQQQQKK
jgi:hypothetical protein